MIPSAFGAHSVSCNALCFGSCTVGAGPTIRSWGSRDGGCIRLHISVSSTLLVDITGLIYAISHQKRNVCLQYYCMGTYSIVVFQCLQIGDLEYRSRRLSFLQFLPTRQGKTKSEIETCSTLHTFFSLILRYEYQILLQVILASRREWACTW